MRKVPLTMLTPDMKLGRAVCHGSNILIQEGTDNLNRFVKSLDRIGIYHLYIEDFTSEGIEVEDIVCDRTRWRCKVTLQETLDKIQNSFSLNQESITGIIENLMEEVMSHSDTLVSLSEIGGTDESTLDHSVNTTIYAIYLGIELGYSRRDLLELAEGVLLHDVGKTMLNKQILFETRELTKEEFEYIKTHTTRGYDVLRKIPHLSERTRRIALNHHERLDGSGYPNGLRGKEIPEFSRIAAIVDVYDALTSDRCYRKAVSPFYALQILMRDSAYKLDLNLTSKFIQNVAAYPNGTGVFLSDGSYGIVKKQNRSMPLRPVVRIIEDENGKAVTPYDLDLMEALNFTIREPECDERVLR